MSLKDDHKQQHNFCKIMIHLIIALSMIILIILRCSIGLFLFYQILIMFAIFDIYYLFIILSSKNLHWFHYDLIGIDGIISMSIPSPTPTKENKRILIGSLSELSAYPGSTSNYIINTTSSYCFIINCAFTIYILNDKYNYNYSKYSTEIATLFLVNIASFGFLLAGHWTVFESLLSTMIHIFGFFMVFMCSTFAIYIQQYSTGYIWLCIVATVVCFILVMIYGYFRKNYWTVIFAEERDAHRYSLYMLFLEWLIVVIIQAQSLAFMRTVIA